MARATLNEEKGQSRAQSAERRAQEAKTGEPQATSHKLQTLAYNNLQPTTYNLQPTKPETPAPPPTTQASNEPLASQFVEELPTDFWSEAVPVEAYADEESNQLAQATDIKITKPRAQSASGIDHPLFAELQTLFPGKILRIEATKQEVKTGDDSKDETEVLPQGELAIEESEG
jgi:hypothetical protein